MADVDALAMVESLVEQVQQMRHALDALEAQRRMQRLVAAQIVDSRDDGKMEEQQIKFTKGSGTVTTLFAPITRLERRAGGLVLTAMVQISSDIAAGLRAGLRGLANRTSGRCTMLAPFRRGS